jgi:hypothetical protein
MYFETSSPSPNPRLLGAIHPQEWGW